MHCTTRARKKCTPSHCSQSAGVFLCLSSCTARSHAGAGVATHTHTHTRCNIIRNGVHGACRVHNTVALNDTQICIRRNSFKQFLVIIYVCAVRAGLVVCFSPSACAPCADSSRFEKVRCGRGANERHTRCRAPLPEQPFQRHHADSVEKVLVVGS